MAKHKYIETPEKMWEYFEAYAIETKDNPRYKVEYVGKDGERVKTPLERPLTIEGFELWMAKNEIIMDLSQYFANTEGRYTEYQTICSRIRKAVRNDQIEGGMVGQYNASITQRLNGLKEQTENVNIEKPIFKGIDLNVEDKNENIEQ
jgi:hypothetical protein